MAFDFDAAWERRADSEIDETTGGRAWVISSSDLIQSKLAAGRPQDILDVAALREAQQLLDTRKSPD
jgi:hypothetical protein